MIRPLLLLSALSLAAFAQPGSSTRFARPEGNAARAASILKPIVNMQKSGNDISQKEVQALRETIETAKKHLAAQSPAGERLSDSLKSSETAQTKAAAADLQNAAREVYDMLSFRPLAEAEMPKGFPTFTGVGVIEVKEYPVYRKAVAKNFGTLFRHITSNGIAMTTPVEMKMTEKPTGELAQDSMAFLYGSPEIGEPGADGVVRIVDNESIKVVSLGLRGSRSKKVVADAVRRLKRWLRANPEYQTAGGFRVMGYNSPFVPRAEQYFEVQLPLRERKVKPSKPGPTLKP
jgi:hypothetical protein